MDDKELLQRLRKVFGQEAKERLTSMSTNLIAIETESDKANLDAILEVVYRDAHSLKGAARSINLYAVESLFQTIESLFGEIRDNQIQLTEKLSDVLLETIKTVDNVICSNDEIESEDNNNKLAEFNKFFDSCIKAGEVSTTGEVDLSEEIEKVIAVGGTETVEPAEEIETVEPAETSEAEPVKEAVKAKISPKKPAKEQKSVKEKKEPEVKESKSSSENGDTIRIVTEKLDSLLLKSENLILIKLIFREQHSLLMEVFSALQESEKRNKKITNDHVLFLKELKETVLFDKRKSRASLSNIMSYLSDNVSTLSTINQKVASLFDLEKENQRSAGNMIDEFLYDVKDLAMMPFSNILDVFPIMIRDIARKLEKKVNFTVTGDNIKVDRRILQEIKDPLIHLLRNSIDHGIETDEVRKRLNKPPAGKIDLAISQKEGGKIEIAITDDGRGIDLDGIREKLVMEKILSQSEIEILSDDEIIEYIFYSGFSTSKIVTELSGRGLGMAIVRNQVEKLGGFITITNIESGGTSVILKLPITMATYKGLIVNADDEQFILPSTDVEKAITVKYEDITSIENKPAIIEDGQTYPLIDLCDLLEIKRKKAEEEQKEEITAAIIGKTRNKIALKIDDIVEEQEILLKDLGELLPRVRNITGATILNSGDIVPVLNVNDLFDSCKNIKYSSIKDSSKSGTGKEKKDLETKKILVVEDSITSRTLLKNILESAGYSVRTAIDGIEGYTELKSGPVDLVLLDVEMPRMNGFELTEKVRADKQLSETPIVLVTSRSTRADRERGIDAGANAYIVKSNFDQNNLLEVVDSFL
jgi:two-component system, chemotaxis family, sensor kinase CheA